MSDNTWDAVDESGAGALVDPMGSGIPQSITQVASPQVSDSQNVPYWRQQIAKFIALLQNIDPVYYTLQSAVADLQAETSVEAQAAYEQGLELLARYENSRATTAGVVQAINAMSDTLGAMGITFPKVGLGSVTVMDIGSALSPAIAIYNDLLRWVFDVNDYADLVKRILPAEALSKWDQLTEVASNAAAAAGAAVQNAVSIAKWIVIGVAAAFAIKMWKDLRS